MKLDQISRNLMECNFTPIGNELVENTDLNASDFRLLVYLLRCREGWNINKPYLANKIGLSESTIKRSLKNLIKLGFVEKTERGLIVREGQNEPKSGQNDLVDSVVETARGQNDPLSQKDAMF